MFVDEAKVILRAGNGGDGCLSFHRAKYVPKGGPDGGDGGKGGDVILLCDENVQDLTAYRFQRQWGASNGRPGEGSQRHGKNGEDCVLLLPTGTTVLREEDGQPVADLVRHGERVCLLEGGRGGLGNIHFKSSVNQSPRKTIPGEEGPTMSFRFVLRTLADVGLVGFPNAGKSTLLGVLTAAHPKTAPYAFTTINPTVGVWQSGDDRPALRIADIPGLIEGSSENKGLGHRFLRHIERCRVLVFLIDMSAADGRDPVKDFLTLRKELSAYGKGLDAKPYVVAASKMDEDGAEKQRKRFERETGENTVPLSAILGEGLDPLLKRTIKALDQVSAAED